MSRQVDQAQRTQRDLLANVSHDLRTPLTSVQGFSQAIIEGAIDDEAGYRRAAKIINSESRRMGRLVQDLLDLARLEGGLLDLESEPVSLAEVLRSEMSKAQPRAEKVGIVFEDRIPDILPGVVADVHRLEQAVANLVDNAIRYSSPNTPVTVTAFHHTQGQSRPESLDVSFGALSTEGPWVSASITNQGMPIAPGELGRVFDRFHRGDASRSSHPGSGQPEVSQPEGSGLGLAIAREAILAHGGRIEVSSGSESGTTFRLWLPVCGGAAR